LGIFAVAFRVGSSGSSSDRSTMRLRVPQCKSCAAIKRIAPASADLEHHRLSILVDRRFAGAVKQLNQAKAALE
jgi:hypothetical protein